MNLMRSFQNIVSLIAFFVVTGAGVTKAQPFIHPGLLQSREDISRMIKGIQDKSEPLYGGYLVFEKHPQSQANYKMQGPFPAVGRNPTYNQSAYDADANAAFQNAVMWAVTGKKEHAAKAVEIINGWSKMLKSVTGRDAVLMAGLGPFKMVNAAEIIRHTDAGWNKADIKTAEVHFLSIIYPVLKDLAPFANGNWDSAALKTIMAIAVFCNNRAIFDKALVYYQYGSGDGSLSNYIINDIGQCQESGRDQGHTQLGIAHLADCSEIAWHQGLDLYGLLNNRLLKGFEYTAKYNLGKEVPYVPAMDRTGKYYHPKISEQDRGKIRAVYEEVFNHFVTGRGMDAPYTQMAAERIRPELQGLPAADHVGFGTFLYSRNKETDLNKTIVRAPVSPAGLFAKPDQGSVMVTWVPVSRAESYSLWRSDADDSKVELLAKGIKAAQYSDRKVKPGLTYRYFVQANSLTGQSERSPSVKICAGLPSGWVLNKGALKNESAKFDGDNFVLEAAGKGIDSGNNSITSVMKGVEGDFILTGRYVPQISSQSTGFGIALRKPGENQKLLLALFIRPEASGQIEAPGWRIDLAHWHQNGGRSEVISSPKLDTPQVTFGRMTGSCWLKVERNGAMVSGYYSSDGKKWLKAGQVNLNSTLALQAGMFAYSGVEEMTTIVKFDQVSIISQNSKKK